MVVARSLKDAARLGSATTSLLLRKSEDLVCRNMMCAKLGEVCVCRLAVHVSRLSGLRELDISDNDLGVLPDSVFELPELEHLDVSGENEKPPCAPPFLYELLLLLLSCLLLLLVIAPFLSAVCLQTQALRMISLDLSVSLQVFATPD